MTKNMGTVDRAVRLVLAILSGILYFTSIISGPLSIVLAVLMVVFLLTSIIGFCPLYAPFKLSTVKRS